MYGRQCSRGWTKESLLKKVKPMKVKKLICKSLYLYLFWIGVCLPLSCKQGTVSPSKAPTALIEDAKWKSELVQLEKLPANGLTTDTPTMILLHGLGSNEKDLFSFAQHFSPEWLVLSLRGPLNIGEDRFSWFQLQRSQLGWTYNFEDVITARELVARHIGEAIEKYKLNPNNICLGGFSQGAILSLATGLKYPDKIRGIVSLSGHLYPEIKNDMANYTALSDSKLFISHGNLDQVLPPEPMRTSVNELKGLGLQVSDFWYDSQHTISSENFRDLLRWLKKEFSE